MTNLTRLDILGNELKLGDTVAFNPPYKKGLKHGFIQAFGRRATVYVNCLQDAEYGAIARVTTGVVKCTLPKVGEDSEEHF